MKVRVVPYSKDNYCYLVFDESSRRGLLVDPADADKALVAAKEEGVTVEQVLITHHHADHSGGTVRLLELLAASPPEVVGGDDRIPAVTRLLGDGEQLTAADGTLHITAMLTPCHTTGHLCYLIKSPPSSDHTACLLFTGDTLFVGGCGRFFEGVGSQMVTNFRRIAALPDSTLIYPGHEYAEANLRFAQTVATDANCKKAIASKLAEVQAAGRAVPSSVGAEKEMNVFMHAALQEKGADKAMDDLRDCKNRA